MTGLTCFRAGILLERRQSGLDEAERLLLEEHLQACAECAANARALGALADLLDETASSRVAPHVVSSAIRKALESPVPEDKPAAPVSRRWLAPAALAAALCVVAALVVWTTRRGPSDGGNGPIAQRTEVAPKRAAPERPSSAARPDRVISGVVESGAHELRSGSPVESARLMIARERAELALAHARAKLGPGSIVRWDSGRSMLALDAGHALISVDPAPGRRFSLETTRFVAEVLGTVFEVWPTGIRVLSGRVRVTARGHAARLLAAGDAWTLEPESASTASSADEVRNQRVPEDVRPQTITARALLARARQRLAEGDAASARRDIASALGAAPSAAESAEARSLLAECAIVEGNPPEAQRAYAQVAERYAGTAAGETALFAAARLERDPARSRERLEAYLKRYPEGRFRAEAEARIRALGSKGE